MSCLKATSAITRADILLEIFPDAHKLINDLKSLLIGYKDDLYMLKFLNSEEEPILHLDANKYNGQYFFDTKRKKALKKEYEGKFEEFNKQDQVLSPSLFKDIDEKVGRMSGIRPIYVEKLINDPLIMELEYQCKLNEQLYVIKNQENNTETRISRFKVLRVCSQMLDKGVSINENTIKYALSYKSLLNIDDVYNIQNYRELARNNIQRG